ncbi:hypothetical protein I8H83_04640 [Candidatus Saccharibacteria bacterium]|nr:hypothetical protein [Candidatus Saccharibacteria bacterium]MBH2007868.1 hypothetical protein [Candidatus Saccharibacteria bacterium]
MNIFPHLHWYTETIFDSGRQPAFVMLVAFLIAFACARGYTRIARHTGWGSVHLGGTHAHHLVFGVVIALVAASIQFALSPVADSPAQLALAAAFGVGAALILDEFALLFYLKDVYWDTDGRKSVDAVVMAVGLGCLFLLHTTPFGKSDFDERPVLFVLTAAQLINMVPVLVCAIKGKLSLALLGVFIPIFAWIGAARLAEPTSVWAQRLYSKKKLSRAGKRYEQYDRVWQPRRTALLDFIGGKPSR